MSNNLVTVDEHKELDDAQLNATSTANVAGSAGGKRESLGQVHKDIPIKTHIVKVEGVGDIKVHVQGEIFHNSFIYLFL